MPARRTHVIIPEDLVSAIDRLVGKRGRSRFIAGAAERELRRLAQLQALDCAVGVWTSGDHPELKRGAAKWVEGLREEAEERFRRVAKR